MAEGENVQFPPEITLSDNDPKSGHYKLILTIPSMKTKKKLFSSVEVTNGECKVQATSTEVVVTARIDEGGKPAHYKYQKTLPESVKKADYDLKDGEVIFKFTKANSESMGQYTDYFRRKP